MKEAAKACLISMALLTIIYIGTVVYANNNSSKYPHRYVVYAAFKYESKMPPPEWYTPEEMGIVEINDFGKEDPSWVQILVDRQKEPFPLQREEPPTLFSYKDKFYQVESLWITPGSTSNVEFWQIPAGIILGTGWSCVGMLFFK